MGFHIIIQFVDMVSTHTCEVIFRNNVMSKTNDCFLVADTPNYIPEIQNTYICVNYSICVHIYAWILKCLSLSSDIFTIIYEKDELYAYLIRQKFARQPT